MQRGCRDRRSGRFSLALAASFLGPQHPSRTEPRTNCRLAESNHLDQIVVTWIFLSVPAFLVSHLRLYQRHGVTSMLSSIPFWLLKAWQKWENASGDLPDS